MNPIEKARQEMRRIRQKWIAQGELDAYHVLVNERETERIVAKLTGVTLPKKITEIYGVNGERMKEEFERTRMPYKDD